MTTPPSHQRQARLWVTGYLSEVYPFYAESCEGISLNTFLRRFNEDFFCKARKDSDSLQKKELKDCWELDKGRILGSMNFETWISFFKSIISQARPISRHKYTS